MIIIIRSRFGSSHFGLSRNMNLNLTNGKRGFDVLLLLLAWVSGWAMACNDVIWKPVWWHVQLAAYLFGVATTNILGCRL